ncbi:MAG: prepilin-type N-terminal cleavage/methylation domain-containing protein [Chthoniobacterales bacterium]
MKSKCFNRSRSRDRLGRKGAFTLLELLVVVSIVALLATLLMATLRNFRLKAAGAVCQSNLRTLATAYNRYRADYRGMGPPSFVKDSTRKFFPFNEGHTYGAIHALRFYYTDGPRYIRDWLPDYTWKIEPREHCPAAKLTGTLAPSIEAFTSHYAMIPGDTVKLDDGKTEQGQANLAAIEKPSQLPIIWDSWGKGFEYSLPLRHGNGLNVAFLDGHVENVPQTKEDGRLYRWWWEAAVSKKTIDPNKLGKGSPLGAKER